MMSVWSRTSIVGTALIALVAVLASGCAAGYGIGTTSASYGVADEGSTLQSQQEVETSTVYHEIRMIDSTGLLLAALVNTGKQYTARQEAIQEAVQRPDTDGDGKVEVEYEYEPMPITPGVITDVRFRFSAGEPNFTYESGPVTFGQEPGYWALDIKSEFLTGTQKDLNLIWSMFFGALFENYSFDAQVDSFDDGPIDVTYGAGLGWAPIPQVMVSGRAQLGLVTWVVSGLVGGDDATYLHGTGDIEVGYSPLKWLTISATGSVGRMSTGARAVGLSRLGVNVLLSTF